MGGNNIENIENKGNGGEGVMEVGYWRVWVDYGLTMVKDFSFPLL
jgi:hypothetical protein